MRTYPQVLIPGALCALLTVSCSMPPDAGETAEAILPTAFSAARNSVERPFKMSRSNLSLDWGIERDQELACEGDTIAGGAISGDANFTHLGRSRLEMSAAWDIGNLLDPDEVQFTPVGPAGGPVAPVLGQDDYPYHFQFNPFTGQCEQEVSATGEVELIAANGDKVFGIVTGGETHRLDFRGPGGVIVPGSGIETFAIIEFAGGTGRFRSATGGFVAHTITRLDFAAQRFVIDLAEVLPGGTISY